MIVMTDDFFVKRCTYIGVYNVSDQFVNVEVWSASSIRVTVTSWQWCGTFTVERWGRLL